MSRVRSAASRVLPRSSRKHQSRALHVSVLLKDGRTVEGYVRREVLLDEDRLLLLSNVTHTFDSDMKEILTTPLDAAIARNQVVDIERVAEEGPTPAAPPVAAPAEESEQALAEDYELHVRLLLKNGRTVEGLAERNALFDADGLVVLTRVVHAFDSEMKEVRANPLDAAVPRGQIVDIAEVTAARGGDSEPVAVAPEPEPATEPESSALEPVPEPEPGPPAPEPEPGPPAPEPEPEPIPIRTGAGGARDLSPDLSPRDDLAVGVLRMRAAQTRVRGAHISLALFALVALALAALLLASALSNNGDQPASATGSPSPAQSPVPVPFGGAGEIAFLRNVSGVPQVHLLELAGGSPVRLAPSDTEQQRPDFSSSGHKLAYSAEVEGRQDIFVSRLDGTGAINVTNNDFDDYVPDFSPDGQSITFSSDLVGDFDIYILDLESGETRVLIDNEVQEASPAWSPDGETIAFASRIDGDFEIYTVDSEGSESPVRLTDNSVDDRAPEWSPDGTTLAYDRAVDGDTEIFITPLGAEERQITDNGVEDRHPAWSPDGRGVFFGRRSLNSSGLYFKSLEPGSTNVLVNETSRGYDPAVR
ncbi:MAG TPA: hypothetical protein VFF07_11830 [Actinomycetota bacterium]|nr:hypothetical protein [Actinomycetota bacterium]